MINFMNVYRSLLPKGEGFRLTNIGKKLTLFFESLSLFPSRVQSFIDLAVIDNIDPNKTNLLEEFEEMYGLSKVGLTDEDRRQQIAATIAAVGGQSPRYLTDILQVLGFPLYVFDWWVSEGNVSPPIARNPFLYVSNPDQLITYGQTTYKGISARYGAKAFNENVAYVFRNVASTEGAEYNSQDIIW